MNYKYGEFENEEEFNHWNRQYGGEFVYPIELEVGTKFLVENGAWYGEIIEENGDKFILVERGNKVKLTPDYYLWVTIGKERNEPTW